MSLYDYEKAQEIWMEGYSFYSLIQAAMREADPENLKKLKAAWPEVWGELEARCASFDGGKLPGDGRV